MSNKTVLGGGIAGLSAAYYLAKKFPSHSISLLEGSSRTGGWIKSTLQQEHLFEQGPRTLRPRGYKGANTLELVEELGLQQEVLPLSTNDPAAKNRMIYVNGKLHRLPSSFVSMFKKQSPFSKPLALYLLKDIITPRKVVPENDESIYSFTKRRFGAEVADYAISPLICGIYAGDAKQISVKILMEELFNYEQKYGNITKGLIYNLFKSTPKHKTIGALNQCAKLGNWSIYTFKNGLETLPKRLEEVNRNLNVNILLNSSCVAIEFDKVVSIHLNNNNKVVTDHLLSCVPAHVLKNLIKGHPKLSALLQSIPYVTVGVVNLQYNCNILDHEGFGFLVPPKENLPILGVIYDSCCYPCGTGTVLTVMMGGHWFNQHFGHNPHKDQLMEVAIYQLCKTLGVTKCPDSYLANIHQDCIPQYVVGHSNIVKDINNYVSGHKLPLSLCGASYNGVGINDVIWQSKIAVDNL